MEIAFEPYKKLSFKSYIQYTKVEEFIRNISIGSPAGFPAIMNLFWANGIIFRFFSLPPSDSLTKEILNGHLVWDHIEYAPMPTYQKEIQGHPERPLVTIIVLDMSNHVVLDPLTKWIKDNLPPFKKDK